MNYPYIFLHPQGGSIELPEPPPKFHPRPDRWVASYPLRIRWILALVVLAVALLLYLVPRLERTGTVQRTSVNEFVEQVDIPLTEQILQPPPASRPSIPVASEDEDLAEEITIEETGLDDFQWDAPPPPPDDAPQIIFVAYSVAPKPIGGYAGISRRLEYPDIAQNAGIEGRVIVQAHIDINGRVVETYVLKGVANTGLDEAAVRAIKGTRFKPALQRDLPVAVWIAIPINFSLTD